MALFRRSSQDQQAKDGQWYYCLRHRTVEEGMQCPATDRLGPYATRQDAERAIATAQERDEEWRNDPRWRDEEDEDPDGGTGRTAPGRG
ncbi:hypothetical protein [Streptomyces spiramenti]|uniref:SPOR domain-containing protein n=1 Tax=Streptomyces spiramenti TaxID=2720606 RepID=A0ABX1AT79_9ACTN|nr:hypothetical protein [Streptomyces spiramenti]NJP67445.1 hypothetical protein [Streptomyces spiramenti]